jgi:hemolysin activation/secretion protein
MNLTKKTMRRAVGNLLISTLLASGFVSVASAQTVPSVVEPGQLERSLRSPNRQQKPLLSPKMPRIEEPGNTAPSGAQKITFVLNKLTVEGSSVYERGALVASVKEKIGQEVSVADVFDIAASLTARYRNDGYLLSTVIVPPQKIDGGVVVLRAVEGFVDRVVVEGVSGQQRASVLRYLNKIVGKRPLTTASLERYLLLVDDLPGVNLQSFMQPSPDNGGAALLTVKPKIKTSNIWSVVANRGSEYVGPYNLEVGGAYNGVTSLGQSLTGRVVNTPLQNEELRYVGLSFVQEVGTEGTSVVITATGMQSRPGEELLALGLESRALGFDVALRAKPYRGREANLFLSFAASLRQGETEALGSVLSEDFSRKVRIGATLQTLDRLYGANSVSVGVSRGLDLLGATSAGSSLASRSDARPDATWFDLGLSRVQSLGMIVAGLEFSVAAEAQYSLNPLSAAREFAVGGLSNGSGFDSSEISGEHGVSGRLELRYSFALGVIDRAVPEDWKGFAMQVFAFGDGGRVWQDLGNGFSGQQNASLASAGGGARFNLGPYTSLSLEVAKPFVQNVRSEGNKDPRVFFNLTNRF